MTLHMASNLRHFILQYPLPSYMHKSQKKAFYTVNKTSTTNRILPFLSIYMFTSPINNPSLISLKIKFLIYLWLYMCLHYHWINYDIFNSCLLFGVMSTLMTPVLMSNICPLVLLYLRIRNNSLNNMRWYFWLRHSQIQ